jgi:zinc finger protein
MLLTVIPYFKEVIVVSFRCEHCGKSLSSSFLSHLADAVETTGYTNNDIQSAGEIQPLGSIYTVKMTERADLDRQLVKSEHCTISIPEYALQIPAGRGQFTTVEGIIADTVRDLSHDQPARLEQEPELHVKLQAVVDKLRLIIEDGKAEGGSERKMPVFTIKLDDPSGNSFIETEGGLTDPKWSKREYSRDNEQNELLGLAPEAVETSHYPEEVLSFPGVCSLCGSTLETLMKTVNIPHFKVRSLASSFRVDRG